MRSIKTVAFSVLVSLAVGATASADVQLSIREGRVSIVARGATVAQILTEWAKVGETKIVNIEHSPRDPMTIELEDVSEGQALDVVLRGASGYVAAPRAVAVPNASRFDRILVMPPSVARPTANVSAQPTRQPASATAGYASTPPAYYDTPETPPQQSASAAPEPAANDAIDEQPLVTVVGGGVSTPTPRPPVANTARQALETVDPRQFLALMQVQGGAVTYPSTGSSPTAVVRPRVGVAVPGTIVQPPKPR